MGRARGNAIEKAVQRQNWRRLLLDRAAGFLGRGAGREDIVHKDEQTNVARPAEPQTHRPLYVARAFARGDVALAWRVAARKGSKDRDAGRASCAAYERERVIDASRDSAAVRDGHGDEAAIVWREVLLVQERDELEAEEFAEGFAGAAEGGELRFVNGVTQKAVVRAEANEPRPGQAFLATFRTAEAFAFERDGFVEADGSATARAERAEGVGFPVLHPDAFAEWGRGAAEPLFFDDGPPVSRGAKRRNRRDVIAGCGVVGRGSGGAVI